MSARSRIAKRIGIAVQSKHRTRDLSEVTAQLPDGLSQIEHGCWMRRAPTMDAIERAQSERVQDTIRFRKNRRQSSAAVAELDFG